MSSTRTAVLAGSWYPAEPSALADTVDGYLAGADPALRPAGKAVLAIVPHAGYIYSGPVAGRVLGLLAEHPPGRVVILSPNHRMPIDRIALTGTDHFATPLGEVAVDAAARDELALCPAFEENERAHTAEHAVEIQLPFLQRLWPDMGFTILPLLVPPLAPEVRIEAARALTRLRDDNTLFLVSTDFTHYGSDYGFVPFTSDIPAALERLDSGAILRILAGDPQGLREYGRKTGITMCGLDATALALETGLPTGYEAALIDYSRSGDRDGDYSLSVSYAGLLICTGKEKENHA